MSIYDASPSVGAYTTEPMTPNEIDAHPDRDRIWATILALRADNETSSSEKLEAALASAKEYEDEASDAQSDLEDAKDRIDEIRALAANAIDEGTAIAEIIILAGKPL